LFKRAVAILACGLLATTAASPLAAQTTAGQQASPGAALLGQCVIGNTTGFDRVLIAQWVGSSLASSPRLEVLVTVDAAAKSEIDQAMAQLFVRLFTDDCVDEARPLVQASDQAAMQVAFSMLGEVAVGELLNDPRAMGAMSAFGQYIPADAFAVFDAE